MNGAANCPECGSRMAIKDTNYGGGVTFRIAECTCGQRWETEERRVRRLPDAGTAIRRYTPVQRDTGQCTPANPPTTVGGVGGGLPSGSDPLPESGPISTPPDQTRAKSNRRTETPAFAAFYELYPRKTDRPASMRAWLSRDCERMAELVMAGLKRWLPDFARREPDKVPHPATWLNGERWNDQPPAPVTQRSFLPPAVRAEQEREDHMLDERAARIFGGSR